MRLGGFASIVLTVLVYPAHAWSQSGAAPTFSKDVMPILQERCQACHRPGEIAPMSLMSFEQVRP